MQKLRIDIPVWFPRQKLAPLIKTLGGESHTRIVGGIVRDIMLDRQHTDIDLATILTPEEVQATLQRSNIKCIPTGIKHGTITAIYAPNQVCEITTLRRDVDCDGRWAKVEFTDRWEEDAMRRDFTINSMFMDLSGNIYDYCNGLADIKLSLVRFVGNPTQRIKEDALRILRYFRLYSYLGGTNIDQASLDSCIQLAGELTKLSGERISKEMLKLLTNDYATAALLPMLSNQIGQHIGLTGIDLAQLKRLHFGADALANLAALLRTSGNALSLAKHIGQSWHLSRKEASALTFLCGDLSTQPLQNLAQDLNIHKRQLYLLKPSLYIRYIRLLNIGQVFPPTHMNELEKIADHYVPPQLPISGYDLLAMGLQKQEVGKMLAYAEDLWIQSDFTLSREELLDVISTSSLNKS